MLHFRLRSPRRARRGWASPATLGLLLGTGLLGCQPGGSEAVVFGVLTPAQTVYGASMRRGAELAAQEVNAGGGIRGRKLVLRVEDDAADPNRAIAAAEALYTAPEVVAVAGPVNSSTTTAAANVFDRGLVALATSATSPLVSRLGPWVFRVASSDSANAVALARRTRTLAQRVAVLYANDDYGRGLASSFEAAFRAQGGAVVESDPYLETTPDLTPYLQRLQRRGVDAVFLAAQEEGAGRVIRQARTVGLRTRFIGGDGLEGLAAMGADYEGTYVGLLFQHQATPQARDFAARFRRAYNHAPDSYAALGYDAVHLLARAAREGGASRAAMRRYLEGVGRPGGSAAFEGAAGVVRFDARGDPLEKSFAVGIIRGGQIVLPSAPAAR